MKKIITMGCLIFISMIGLLGCGNEKKDAPKETVNSIHYTTSNGSIYKYKSTDMDIKNKKQISSILNDLNDLKLSKHNKIKVIENLVGATTYNLKLKRETKLVKKYKIIGNNVMVKTNNNKNIYRVNNHKISKLVNYLDRLSKNKKSTHK